MILEFLISILMGIKRKTLYVVLFILSQKNFNFEILLQIFYIVMVLNMIFPHVLKNYSINNFSKKQQKRITTLVGKVNV